MAEKIEKPAEKPKRRVETRVIPSAPLGEENSIYASLNGRTYNIPRGKAVTLPAAVWEIVDMRLRAEAKAEEELRKHR